MGRNATIKRYELHPQGQAIDLFARGARSPVVAELLSAPWISRASDLLSEEADAPYGGAGKRARREVDVEWDRTHGRPAAFRLEGKGRYEVEALIGYWVEDRFWWDPAAHVSRRCFRVLARAGVWDLAWDRITHTWSLVGIGD
jgi:hypothetical protein